MQNNPKPQQETSLKISRYKFTEQKKTCDMPAYLFWKMQSHLIKLAHKLRRQKLKTTAGSSNDSTAGADKD